MSLERLENAHAIMVLIVAGNPEGRRLVPIVRRLETEIASLRSVESDYDRILQLANAR
jgi:hypothetical protein